MAMAINWDDGSKKYYETGLDRSVLFVRNDVGEYTPGVAWNGMISVSESPEGAEPTELWANNARYATLVSPEKFNGSIEAYTYPEEWGVCDGSVVPSAGVQVRQQQRRTFGLSYRTTVNSEAGGEGVFYKIHLVYGAKASPSESTLNTINDSPEAQTFSWDFTTTPVGVEGYQPSSKLVIDTDKVSAGFLEWLEEKLYGVLDPLAAPILPLPAEVIAQAILLA